MTTYKKLYDSLSIINNKFPTDISNIIKDYINIDIIWIPIFNLNLMSGCWHINRCLNERNTYFWQKYPKSETCILFLDITEYIKKNTLRNITVQYEILDESISNIKGRIICNSLKGSSKTIELNTDTDHYTDIGIHTYKIDVPNKQILKKYDIYYVEYEIMTNEQSMLKILGCFLECTLF